MKYLLPIIVFLVAGCSAKEEQFCQCLEAGEELNTASHEFMTKTPTAEDQENIKILKDKKKEACANYQEMSGEEMRSKKEACESN